MERLPYIDEHATTVRADRAATWSALLWMWCGDTENPATVRSPFFWLGDAETRTRLALDGAHPFATYRLAFELADAGPRRTRLTARTRAAFPGVLGTVYKALVIGTGGHRVVVRRMLKHIANEAEKLDAAVS